MISRRTTVGFALPLARRHPYILQGSSQTIQEAVEHFIETPNEAAARLAQTLRSLRRNPTGKRAADYLACCQHDKAGSLFSDCFVCARNHRVSLVPQVIAFAQRAAETSIIVLLLDEIAVGALSHVNLPHIREALRKRLRRAGVAACIGNIELAYKPEKRKWNLHAHLIVFGPCQAACSRLAAQSKMKRAVKVEALDPRRMIRQVSYQLKFVTYYKHPSSRRILPLPDDQLAELIRWRQLYRFLDHLLLLGFQRRAVIVPGAAFELLSR